MNKAKRKRLGKAFDLLDQAMEIVEEVKNDEQEAHDNLPDQFRYGDRGGEMEAYIEMLDETYGYLDDAKSVIEQI